MQVIRESATNTQMGDRPFYDFLEGCLRHKAEMVIFEAARAITELNGVTSRELTPAITVLQLFLSSSKPVLRFAAVRTLNKVTTFLSSTVINLCALILINFNGHTCFGHPHSNLFSVICVGAFVRSSKLKKVIKVRSLKVPYAGNLDFFLCLSLRLLQR